MDKTYIQEKLTGNYGQVLTFDNSGELVVTNIYPSQIVTSAFIHIKAPLGAVIKVTDNTDTYIASNVLENGTELFVPYGSDSYISSDDNTMYVKKNTEYIFSVPHLGYWYVYIDGYQLYSSQEVRVDGTGDYYTTVSYFSCNLSIDYTAGSSCQCSNGEETLIANDDSGSWTFKITSPGKWSVMVYKTLDNGQTISSSRLVEVSSSDIGTTISISVSVISEVLNDNSWESIRYASREGIATSYWNIGDRKSVILNGSISFAYPQSSSQTIKTFDGTTTYYVCIIGFDHNKELEGNGITFQFGFTSINSEIGFAFTDDLGHYNQQVSYGFIMNRVNGEPTSAGGWNNCIMRNQILGTEIPQPNDSSIHTFLSVLPRELLDVMKPVYKYTYNIYSNYNPVSPSYDYLFLLCPYEYFGASVSYSGSEEQNFCLQYDYYVSNISRAGRYQENLSYYCYHWTRTCALPGNSYNYYSVYNSNSLSSVWSDVSYAIAPAFVVG